MAEPEPDLSAPKAWIDVHSIAAWEFLFPWCKELERVPGRLRVSVDGRLQGLGSHRSRRAEEPEGEDEGVNNEDKRQREMQRQWRLREAWELLVLVAHLDAKVWKMLLRQKCGVRSENLGLFTREEEGDENSVHEVIDGQDEEVLIPDGFSVEAEEAFKQRRRLDRDGFVLPQLEFTAFLDKAEDVAVTVFDKWGWFFMVKDVSLYEPSPEYLRAKAQILAMPFPFRSPVPRLVSIPVAISVDLSYGCTPDLFVRYLKGLRELIDDVKSRGRELKQADGLEVVAGSDRAENFTYEVADLRLIMSNFEMTEESARALAAVVGAGVPIGWLAICLTEQKPEVDHPASRQAFATFLQEVLIHPPKVPRIGGFEVRYGDTSSWVFEALYSALSVSRTPIENLFVAGQCLDDETRKRYWEMMAQTLLHSRSSNCCSYSLVHCADIFSPEIGMDDVATIIEATQAKESVEQHPRKVWFLREGTQLELIGGSTGEGGGDTVCLGFDTCVQLMESQDGENDLENAGDSERLIKVIVPAYGSCRVPKRCLVDDMPDQFTETNTDSTGGPLKALSVYPDAHFDSAIGMENLLRQIGWALEHLYLHFFGAVGDDVVNIVLRACPQLTSLAFDANSISLSRLAATYEEFSQLAGETCPAISTMMFDQVESIGQDHGLEFMRNLGDPTTHLAKHLTELTIYTNADSGSVNDDTFRELWLALANNSKLEKVLITISPFSASLRAWEKRFCEFNGQLIQPHPLGREYKLAFLSATYGELRALQRLDRRVLSLIFELAATRVIRSVNISPG